MRVGLHNTDNQSVHSLRDCHLHSLTCTYTSFILKVAPYVAQAFVLLLSLKRVDQGWKKNLIVIKSNLIVRCMTSNLFYFIYAAQYDKSQFCLLGICNLYSIQQLPSF